MSIGGNNNVLLGAGAALPTGVTSNAVVLGSAASTVYLGGSAVSASPTTLALAANVRLQAGANPGVENQVLKSTGSSIQWANAAIAANSNYADPWIVQAGYTTYVVPSGATGTPTLTLPAANTTALIGVLLSVKNVSLLSLTISGTGLVAVNSTNVIPFASIGSGGSCSLASDGTNWFMLDVTGPVPAAPSAPTSVRIDQPAGGSAPADLTVRWEAASNATSYLVTIAQIIGGAPVTMGTISMLASATSIAVPAIAGSYVTATNTSAGIFQAFVTAYNNWAPGPTGNSTTYDFTAPRTISIDTPVGGSANPPLTIRWTPPAFTVGSYFINVYVNNVLQPNGPVTSLTYATVNNVSVNNNYPIRADVQASKSGGIPLTTGISSSYYWATPSILICTADRNDLANQVTNIVGTWINPYGTYDSVTIELWQEVTGERAVLQTNTLTVIPTTYSWPGPYPSEIIGERGCRYYFVLTYSPWFGYVATGTSNDA